MTEKQLTEIEARRQRVLVYACPDSELANITEDLPALLAEVRRLRALRAQMLEALELAKQMLPSTVGPFAKMGAANALISATVDAAIAAAKGGEEKCSQNT